MKNVSSLSDKEMIEELAGYIKSDLSNKEKNRAGRIIERIKAYFDFSDERWEKYDKVKGKIDDIINASDGLYEILHDETQVKQHGISTEIKSKMLSIISTCDSLNKFFEIERSKAQQNSISNYQAAEAGLIVSYLDSPSRASLMDLSRRQFVLIKVRYGAVGSFLIDIAKDVLEQIDEVEKNIKGSTHEQTELMLRGIWYDDKNDILEIHLDLLHSDNETIFQEKEIAKKFRSYYQETDAKIIVNVKSAFMLSDSFSSLSDDYYLDVKKSLYW